MEMKDVQLLIYVESDKYEPCIYFYETVLGLTSFYGWDDAEDERGRKYKVAGTVLVVLTQENFLHEPVVPVTFQIEVSDADGFYKVIKERAPDAIRIEPFTRPYGWRVFRIGDPADNQINFYQVP